MRHPRIAGSAERGGREGRPSVDADLLREVRRIQVRTDRLVTDVVAGGYSSVFRGSGIEFDEVREWVEGDDFRSVDWNVTARAGRPFVKKYVEERELTLLFVLDCSRSMDFGSLRVEGVPKTLRRLAVELVACLGLSANRNNDKIGLVTFGAEVELFVPPKKGRPHLLRLLREALAPVAADRGSALAEALAFAGRVLRKRAVVFVLSDFLAGFPAREARLAARRHDLILVPCLDPRLGELGDAGLVRLRDLESGEERLVDSGSAAVRARYATERRAWLEGLRQAARRCGADWLPLDTREPVAHGVLGFFRRREQRSARR